MDQLHSCFHSFCRDKYLLCDQGFLECNYLSPHTPIKWSVRAGWQVEAVYVHNLIMTARRRSKFICPLWWIILIQPCAKLTFCVAKFINLSLGKVRNIFPFFCFLSGHWDNIHQLQQPLRDWNCCWGQTLAFIFLSSLLTQPSNHTLLTIAASQVLVSHLSWTSNQPVNSLSLYKSPVQILYNASIFLNQLC